MLGEKIPLFFSEATGTYVCARCGYALFGAHQQFDAGCGFPSFWLHLAEGVTQKQLDTYGRSRIQLLCRHCGQHLGHLFPNKHTPTGLRYCISHTAIRLQESESTVKNIKMSNNTTHFDELKEFIKTQRSNEGNFETVHQKLSEEHAYAQQAGLTDYAESLQEILDKQVADYRNAQDNAGIAWPEYEKLITAWERAIAAAGNGG